MFVFISFPTPAGGQNRTINYFLISVSEWVKFFLFPPEKNIFHVGPKNNENRHGIFFLKNNGQFSLSLTIRVQKRQIITVCDQIQNLLKCAPIITVTYYFKVSSAKPCI